jgi:hypothetical protein
MLGKHSFEERGRCEREHCHDNQCEDQYAGAALRAICKRSFHGVAPNPEPDDVSDDDESADDDPEVPDVEEPPNSLIAADAETSDIGK